MLKRCAALLGGLALAGSLAGCCCGMNRCSPCGFAPASPCGPSGCSPAFYPPGGTGYYQGYGSTAFTGDPALGTAAIPGTFTTTAALPTHPLPTY
jgi:hypothetical protein